MADLVWTPFALILGLVGCDPGRGLFLLHMCGPNHFPQRTQSIYQTCYSRGSSGNTGCMESGVFEHLMTEIQTKLT